MSEDGLGRRIGSDHLPLEASAPRDTGPDVDVLVCFDTTGSMSDKIAGLVAQTATFVREAATRQLNLRWGLIAFGDLRVPGDRIVQYPFTTNIKVFAKALRGMPTFLGGGNRSETSLDALSVAALHRGWSSQAVRMCILLTDEPSAGLEVDLETVGRQLRDRRIVVFCVSPDHRAYRWLAQVTGGEWWDIYERVPFDRLLERLARKMMQLAEKLRPLLGSGSEALHPKE